MDKLLCNIDTSCRLTCLTHMSLVTPRVTSVSETNWVHQGMLPGHDDILQPRITFYSHFYHAQ